MTNEERAALIEADRFEYERRHKARHRARMARYERNSRRGLAAAIALMPSIPAYD